MREPFAGASANEMIQHINTLLYRTAFDSITNILQNNFYDAEKPDFLQLACLHGTLWRTVFARMRNHLIILVENAHASLILLMKVLLVKAPAPPLLLPYLKKSRRCAHGNAPIPR